MQQRFFVLKLSAGALLASTLTCLPLASQAQAPATVRIDDSVKWRLEMLAVPVPVFAEQVRKSQTSPQDAKEVQKVCGDCRFELSADAQGNRTITVSAPGSGPVLGQSGYDENALKAQTSSSRSGCPKGQTWRDGKCK